MIVNRDTLHPYIKLPQNTSRSLPQCLRSSAWSVHWFAAGLRHGHCYVGCVIQVERSAQVAVALTRRAQVLEDISNSLFCSVMVLTQGIIATGGHCCDIKAILESRSFLTLAVRCDLRQPTMCHKEDDVISPKTELLPIQLFHLLSGSL